MKICYSCGAMFERARRVRMLLGEFWGAPCFEEYAVCPHCGGEVEEVRQ